ncbi:MAG: DUF1206 domain-containing protein [Acidimicrobiales bacterium]
MASLLARAERTGDDLAERAEDSPWLEGLARAGLAARGVLYCLVALLALHVAFGDRDAEPGKPGALEALARQPLGKVLLLVVAGGFAGYALWRLLSALLDTEGEGEAVGVDGALRRLADGPYGPWLLGTVAVGLLLFGIYSFVEARYRRLLQG